MMSRPEAASEESSHNRVNSSNPFSLHTILVLSSPFEILVYNRVEVSCSSLRYRTYLRDFSSTKVPYFLHQTNQVSATPYPLLLRSPSRCAQGN